MEKKEYENNIVYDSYYLVNLFKRDNGRKVTQLQIQKLMYFFEAYYMNVKNVDSLYDCPFKAWAFGPVAIPLYTRYKNLGDSGIELDEQDEKIGDSITDEKKKMIEKIYNVFGKKLTAMDLVSYTHMEGSPWSEKWNENEKRIIYGEKSDIDKIKTKEWFKENFIKSND